ncbi:hypothetical protein LRR81_15620 [Metabacillus sp. GX 13764]|uniref:hypothetical protein n=1 Tax=Metabacillus kandeliae TaxID=2900151 RepID=UPI001E365FFD|nr:hypothetical protein [Metabacillus kandeliae]MCD7035673.1 hypothetical protein [Metabacillus kandeliae]
MSLFSRLFTEKCPKCQQKLVLDTNKQSYSMVVKVCPENHYEKVYHPALESFIEIEK